MKKINAAVLITTANDPPLEMPYLAMKSAAERRIAAKAALYFWASQGIQKIVLADATSSNLLSKKELEEVSLLGLKIEQISYCQNSEDVVVKGKGYAEGELIRFALNNSQLLENELTFYKSTGKTFVRNFPAIDELIRKVNAAILFWRHLGDGTSMQPWADCRFYFTSKEFALKELIQAYSQSDDAVAACEYYVFQILNRKLRKVNALRHQISGFEGGSGSQYFDGSLGSIDFGCPGWM